MPESAILVAKYPAAFVNYPTSSAQMEQQVFQTVVQSTDRNMNGVSVYPSREMDYQLCRGHDCIEVAPSSVDMKQREEVLSEMQRQNGFDAISNLQQEGKKGMVGKNVVGRGGVVGGSCPGLSEPVPLLRMQYAKLEQHSGRSNVREEESWRP
ncbi:hypothetical protein DITRI_Ditri12bG0086900 [Diplodiscus trichospermus]